MQAGIQICECTFVREGQTRDNSNNISLRFQDKASRDQEWEKFIKALDFSEQQMRGGLPPDKGVHLAVIDIICKIMTGK